MQEIIDKARDLASSILASPAFKNLREVENAVIADEEARDLTARYEQLTLNLRQKESEMQPISPDDKHELVELREKVEANAKLGQLREAQGAYYALMEAVNGTIHATLDAGFKEGAPEEPPEAAADGESRIILP